MVSTAEIPLVYDELKKLAAGHLLRREGRECRLETTALVHEVFLRLVGSILPMQTGLTSTESPPG